MKCAVETLFKALMVVALFFVLGICIVSLFSISAEGDSGLEIDLFCQHGGLGRGVASSPFIVGSRIILFAYVTYNQEPVPSVLVAFQVNNPQGSLLLIAVEPTNASGYATTNFTITENSYSSFPSLWEAIATASPAQNTVNDTMPFLILSPLTVGGISSSTQALATRSFAKDLFAELLAASVLTVFAKFRKRESCTRTCRLTTACSIPSYGTELACKSKFA